MAISQQIQAEASQLSPEEIEAGLIQKATEFRAWLP
jgi:hypothetical protein